MSVGVGGSTARFNTSDYDGWGQEVRRERYVNGDVFLRYYPADGPSRGARSASKVGLTRIPDQGSFFGVGFDANRSWLLNEHFYFGSGFGTEAPLRHRRRGLRPEVHPDLPPQRRRGVLDAERLPTGAVDKLARPAYCASHESPTVPRHRRRWRGRIARACVRAAQSADAAGVKTVRTPVLEIGYHESGPASAFPVLLLHGFPDDAHAYDRVAPQLAAAGYRAFAIYLRGYGPTRFLDPAAPRMAEQAAIGQDVIDFADALRLPRFAVCGYDWGGRARVHRGGAPSRARAGGGAHRRLLDPEHHHARAAGVAARRCATPGTSGTSTPSVGRAGPREEPRARSAGSCGRSGRRPGSSPTRSTTCTAPSFDNPDFVDCVVHSYRHRNFNAPGEPRFLEVEKRLAARPKVRGADGRAARRRRRLRPAGARGHAGRARAVPEARGPARRGGRRPLRAAREAAARWPRRCSTCSPRRAERRARQSRERRIRLRWPASSAPAASVRCRLPASDDEPLGELLLRGAGVHGRHEPPVGLQPLAA